MLNKKSHHAAASQPAAPRLGTTPGRPDRGRAGAAEREPSPDKQSGGAPFPGNAWAVRKRAPAARRYWPSANSQRAPSRPQGPKKAPR